MKFKVVHVMHQGDVLFLKLEAAPKELKQQMKTPIQIGHKEDLILQHGEVMGHYHKVMPQFTGNLMAYDLGTNANIKEMALVVHEPTPVVHEEHSALTLTPGFWIARTQREHSQGITRRVVD